MQFILYLGVGVVCWSVGFAMGKPIKHKQSPRDALFFDNIHYWLNRMDTMYAVDCQLNPNCSREFKVACATIRKLLDKLGENKK